MDNKHINPAFDSAIRKMDELLRSMEDAVAAQIAGGASTVFGNERRARAQAVYQKDAKLNLLGKDVEEHALSVLAKHQPVAEDLRRAVGALKMSIANTNAPGDYVKHLANSIGRIARRTTNNRLFFRPSTA